MPHPLRWILVAVTCLIAGRIAWQETGRTVWEGFHVEETSPPSPENQRSFFQGEAINPGQNLPMVHVASLVEMSDQTLAAVWYGGSGECSPDVRIYGALQRKGATEWSPPRAIMTREQAEKDLGRPVKSLGNALLLANPSGSLRLLFVTIAMGRWSGSQLNTCLSSDGGATWSRAERLTLSPLFNFSELVRNRPVGLESVRRDEPGGWCVPIYQEFLGKFPELLWLQECSGRLAVRKSRIAGGCSTFQPSLTAFDLQHALVLLRDYTQSKRIFLSRTDDGGRSWGKPEITALPNPDAGISGLRLSDERMITAFNDSVSGRDNLTLAVSADEGRSWKRFAVIEKESGASFSYPYLMRTSDGLIHLAYTWKSKTIRSATFTEGWIVEQEAKQ